MQEFGGQAAYLDFSQSVWILVEHGVSRPDGGLVQPGGWGTGDRVSRGRESGGVWWAGSLPRPLPVFLVSGRAGGLCPCWRLGHSKEEGAGWGIGWEEARYQESVDVWGEDSLPGLFPVCNVSELPAAAELILSNLLLRHSISVYPTSLELLSIFCLSL